MNRRKTITALLTLAAAGPQFVRAQKPGERRRVGVLMGYAENDAEGQKRFAVFKQGLSERGWVEGKNLALDVRWSAGNVERADGFARELAALKPDVVFAVTTPVTAAMQREARGVPIVFAVVSDPIGSGFIKSLARPGGNITGFINLEASLAEKWLQLLKELAPRVTRVAVLFNPRTAPYAEYYLQPMNAVASKIGAKVYAAPVQREEEIDAVIAKAGSAPGGGLIAMTDSFIFVNRKRMIEAAARHKVPAMYYVGNMIEEGGLISYGVEYLDLFRRASGYIDRILRGAKPENLPVEQPAKFELFVNAKAAKALGLTIPQGILIRAQGVIE